MLLTLPEQKGSGFDPAKVELKRKQQSTTQGSTIVSYDGKNIGTFDDPPTLNSQTGQYHQRPDQYWIDIMRRRYGGDPQMGIKPLDQGVNFRSSHYDEPNILAHVRYNDRVIDGKKTLFVEEVQSDWHQKGKREGYAVKPMSGEVFDQGGGYWGIKWDDGTSVGGWRSEQTARQVLAERASTKGGGVPDAPFKTTWPELAMKRIIREAAEKGYDKVAWTPGSVQAERYDLSKHIKRITLEPSLTGGGSEYLAAYDHSGKRVIDKIVTREEMPDLIGKDMAEKLINQPEKKISAQLGLPGSTTSIRELSGLDLKVGGEGMKGFYDEILPAAVNKLVEEARRAGTADRYDSGDRCLA